MAPERIAFAKSGGSPLASSRSMFRFPAAASTPAAPVRRGQPAFWSLAAVATLMTFADLEATQDCLHEQSCTEANPLMPSRRAKVYAIQIPELLGILWGSYRLHHAGHSRLAQIPLAALIVIHTAGTALAIRAEAPHR